MPPSRPTATPRMPGAVPAKPAVKLVDDAAISAMEAKYTKRELTSVEAKQPSAPLQARKPASLQAQDTASPQASEYTSSTAARSGTLDAPYVRARDGQATRSTTMHMPVEIHQRLRMAAVSRGVHMSRIVAEAVADWLDTHNA